MSFETTIDYEKLGKRIQYIRKSRSKTQEDLASETNLSREYISLIEIAKRKPTINSLVKIANALEVSADDLLADSLKHPTSVYNSRMHQLILDCNETEEKILIEMLKHMKAVLVHNGI